MEFQGAENQLFISEKEQQVIKNTPILLVGDHNSIIAECILRLGFEHITIITSEKVNILDFNNANYTLNDISTVKSDAIGKRLQAINSNAVIQTFNCVINQRNAKDFIKKHQIAINTLCFSSDIPFFFDDLCQQYNVPVIHPYSLGWGGLIAVIMPNGLTLKSIVRNDEEFNELKIVEYASGYSKFWLEPQHWLDEIIEKYKSEKQDFSNNKLSASSWLIAGMCTHLLYKIATKKEVKSFPEFYLNKL